MRLKESDIETIVESIKTRDKDAKVYLFGSRAHDFKKGGDIDLLVISQKLNYTDSIKIRQRLHEILGEQKIHLIITKDLEKPFVKMVCAEGVPL
ncbi:MAG: nucleotidyltransferase domain-containing protein [Deltaproteobacteria bacterium]|nr:nucleotidyltransferase domain-containing protein [Deltaproteobacteria bacterium]